MNNLNNNQTTSTFMLKYTKEINKLKVDKNDINNRGIRTEGLNSIFNDGLKDLNSEDISVSYEFFKHLMSPLLDSLSEKIEKNRGTVISILNHFIDKLNFDDEYNSIIPEIIRRTSATPFPETCNIILNNKS